MVVNGGDQAPSELHGLGLDARVLGGQPHHLRQASRRALRPGVGHGGALFLQRLAGCRWALIELRTSGETVMWPS